MIVPFTRTPPAVKGSGPGPNSAGMPEPMDFLMAAAEMHKKGKIDLNKIAELLPTRPSGE